MENHHFEWLSINHLQYRKKKIIEQSEQWMIFQRLPRGDFSLSKKGWLLVIPSAFLAGVRKGTTASGARKCWSGARLMQLVPSYDPASFGLAMRPSLVVQKQNHDWTLRGFFYQGGSAQIRHLFFWSMESISPEILRDTHCNGLEEEMAGAFGDFEQVRGDYDKARSWTLWCFDLRWQHLQTRKRWSTVRWCRYWTASPKP